MSDLELLVQIASNHPAALGSVAAVCLVVVVGAQVRPSEAWALAHPQAFQFLRLCRAILPYLVKAAEVSGKLRGSAAYDDVVAFFAKGRASTPPTPVPPAQDRPTEPPTDAPDTDPTPPASLGGGGRRV